MITYYLINRDSRSIPSDYLETPRASFYCNEVQLGMVMSCACLQAKTFSLLSLLVSRARHCSSLAQTLAQNLPDSRHATAAGIQLMIF